MPISRQAIAQVSALGLLVAGCNPADPGLEEKLTRSNAELASARKELASAKEVIEALKQELEAARSASAASSQAAAVNTAMVKPIEKDALEEGYVNAARALQRKLESSVLTDYRIESFTLHPVEIAPQVTAPYFSRLQMTFTRKADSSPIHIDLPVHADHSGTWKFPSLEEVAATLAAGGTPRSQMSPPTSVSTLAPPQRSNQPAVGSNLPDSMMSGTPTFIFDWNSQQAQQAAPSQPLQLPQPAQSENPSSQLVQPPGVLPEFAGPGEAAPPPSQQPAPQPPAREPVRAMPADRDVIIQF